MSVSQWRILLPLGYMAALLLLSSIPGVQTEDAGPAGQVFQWITPEWQNLLHVPLYAGLAASWLWVLTRHARYHRSRLAITLLLTCAWAVVDEAYQLHVPGRYGSLTDLALNLLGASLAVIYAGLGNLLTPKREDPY